MDEVQKKQFPKQHDDETGNKSTELLSYKINKERFIKSEGFSEEMKCKHSFLFCTAELVPLIKGQTAFIRQTNTQQHLEAAGPLTGSAGTLCVKC